MWCASGIRAHEDEASTKPWLAVICLGGGSSGLLEFSDLETQRPLQFLLNVGGDQLLVVP